MSTPFLRFGGNYAKEGTIITPNRDVSSRVYLANQYQTSERYYKLPKVLFESERYKDMKLEVKVAYAVLKDRLELSLSKGWIDEDGAIYLIYSNSNLMALLGCSKSKLLSIKKTLREYGLIDEVQQSSSERGRMANKIYLGELEHETSPV